VLAPSVHEGGKLVGFDVVDLASGRRAPLARIGEAGTSRSGRFTFSETGLSLGAGALDLQAAGDADLVIVDEFGPLELRGGGWRGLVDALVAAARGVIVLVVRDALLYEVSRLYEAAGPRAVAATDPGAIESVIAAVRGR